MEYIYFNKYIVIITITHDVLATLGNRIASFCIFSRVPFGIVGSYSFADKMGWKASEFVVNGKGYGRVIGFCGWSREIKSHNSLCILWIVFKKKMYFKRFERNKILFTNLQNNDSDLYRKINTNQRPYRPTLKFQHEKATRFVFIIAKLIRNSSTCSISKSKNRIIPKHCKMLPISFSEKFGNLKNSAKVAVRGKKEGFRRRQASNNPYCRNRARYCARAMPARVSVFAV